MNKHHLYPRLAARNLKKNYRFFLPYLITCIASVAMFYMIGFLAYNPAVESITGGHILNQMLGLGVQIVAIFSVIFLFYTNSFLIKRRKQEFGLYNLLGMDKHHIGRVLFFETLYTGLIGIAVGLIAGILFSKLLLLLLFKIIGAWAPFGFSISLSSVRSTLVLFTGIFIAILITTIFQIRISEPLALIQGGKVGEREPKGNRLIAAAGFLATGTGYIIAIRTGSPVDALVNFFIAVILVIIGTYALFISGSIALLKWLRKRKSFYYNPKHFTAVSGMFYRMKQNAAGLASICILSTMVLVTLSTTSSLYVGIEDILVTRYPTDYEITLTNASPETVEETLASIQSIAEQENRSLSDLTYYRSLSFSVSVENGQIGLNNDASINMYQSLYVITASEYNRLTGRNVQLNPEEVLFYSSANLTLPDNMLTLGKTYQIAETLDQFPVKKELTSLGTDNIGIVVADETVLKDFKSLPDRAYGEGTSKIQETITFNSDGTSMYKRSFAARLSEALTEPAYETPDSYYASIVSKENDRIESYSLYGSFLFLGIYLGSMFLMATVLIIYYKQISEGYSDQARFEIMQKVGMSPDEIRKSIRSQILIVFFMPLLTAVLHVAAAFNMMQKLLGVLYLYNVPLYLLCTCITILIFALVYTAVYMRTARSYYKIVSGSH